MKQVAAFEGPSDLLNEAPRREAYVVVEAENGADLGDIKLWWER